MDHLTALTIRRGKAVLREVQRMQSSVFQQESSTALLVRLADALSTMNERLEFPENPPSPETIRVDCREASKTLAYIIPVIGIVQRSSNIRIAFEMYEPLRFLCLNLFSHNQDSELDLPNLVLSSEWDYSPLFYPTALERGGSPAYEDFILLGIPACDSQNPLILPLMAHELGHAFWHRIVMKARFGQPFADLRVNLEKQAHKIATDNWEIICNAIGIEIDDYPAPSLEDLEINSSLRNSLETFRSICRSQAEETFCDLFGIAIFGHSYLRAFSSLVSPGFSQTSTRLYPSLSVRVQHMFIGAYHILKEGPPASFTEDFSKNLRLNSKAFPIDGLTAFDESTPKRSHDQNLYDLAETVVINCAEMLAHSALLATKNAGINLPQMNDRDRARAMLLEDMPAWGVHSLGALLDGAWTIAEELEQKVALEKSNPTPDTVKITDLEQSILNLREALLKSIEVLGLEELQ